MKKIKITRISAEVYSHKGFDEQGCIGSACQDMCCDTALTWIKSPTISSRSTALRLSVSAAHDLRIFLSRSGQATEISSAAIPSGAKSGTAGCCIFRLPGQKGCILFKLAADEDLPRRIIPSICRLFPITWNKETLEYYEKENIPVTCNCLEKRNRTERTVFETQQEAIDDIFEIDI